MSSVEKVLLLNSDIRLLSGCGKYVAYLGCLSHHIRANQRMCSACNVGSSRMLWYHVIPDDCDTLCPTFGVEALKILPFTTTMNKICMNKFSIWSFLLFHALEGTGQLKNAGFLKMFQSENDPSLLLAPSSFQFDDCLSRSSSRHIVTLIAIFRWNGNLVKWVLRVKLTVLLLNLHLFQDEHRLHDQAARVSLIRALGNAWCHFRNWHVARL